MGKKVSEFEDNICKYLNVKHSVAMNNGTSTLHALLAALECGPGDEVIIPSLTYISSANVILNVGAKHLLLDDKYTLVYLLCHLNIKWLTHDQN